MSGCPAWCTGSHDGEQRHLAELQTVYLQGVDHECVAPAVFVDLRQGPDDTFPAVHLTLDKKELLQLAPVDAVRIGWALIEQGLMAGGDLP